MENDSVSKIDLISNKPYHEITIKSILPPGCCKLAYTVYVLGSPGAGKTKLLEKVMEITGGTFVKDAGVYNLFKKHLCEYMGQKGGIPEDYLIWDDFDMPNIDGVFLAHVSHFSVSRLEAQDTHDDWCRGIYQECTPHIRGGGKSAFPDWGFVSLEDKRYVQIIVYPGHFPIQENAGNRSTPKPPKPNLVVYLVDPEIASFDRDGESFLKKTFIAANFGRINRLLERHNVLSVDELPGNVLESVYSDYRNSDSSREKMSDFYENKALEYCHHHLEDVLEFEERDFEVHWYLSKTPAAKLEEKREKARIGHNTDPDLGEICRRCKFLGGFDSFESSPERVAAVVGLKL